ncbi:hypothetical protein [Arcobacter sp.]
MNNYINKYFVDEFHNVEAIKSIDFNTRLIKFDKESLNKVLEITECIIS